MMNKKDEVRGCSGSHRGVGARPLLNHPSDNPQIHCFSGQPADPASKDRCHCSHAHRGPGLPGAPAPFTGPPGSLLFSPLLCFLPESKSSPSYQVNKSEATDCLLTSSQLKTTAEIAGGGNQVTVSSEQGKGVVSGTSPPRTR